MRLLSTILYHLLDHQFARRRQQGDVLDLDQSLRILHTHLTLILFYHPRVQSVLVLVYPIATDHLYPDILPLLVDVPPLGLDHPRREVPVRTMRINMITPGIVNPPEGEPGIESLARTKDGNIQVQEEERKGFDPMSWKGNVTENGPREHVRELMEEACGHGAVITAGVKLKTNVGKGPERNKGLSYSLRRLAQRRRVWMMMRIILRGTTDATDHLTYALHLLLPHV